MCTYIKLTVGVRIYMYFDKGEKSLTSKYGLVPESPDFLRCEKPTFSDFITSLIFKISWLLAEKMLFE